MKTTKIIIKNLFGITETQLDGQSVELSGKNGVGKSSVLDAVRYALTNRSDRDYIIRNGEKEGEILIETDTGLSITRKKRNGKSDYKMIKDNEREVHSPESFLSELFTPLQLNPVEFLSLPAKEQNREILNLIDFEWDLAWIQQQFGEIPEGVDYSQHILQVLNDIQSENGVYYLRRQELNRDIRNKRAFIAEIAAGIPDGYKADRWEAYDLGAKYRELTDKEKHNSQVLRAKAFQESYNNKIRGLKADREIEKSAFRKTMAAQREDLQSMIEKAREQIYRAEREIASMDEKISANDAVLDANFEAAKAKLDGDMNVAAEYSGREVFDVSSLQAEINEAEQMKKLINEYCRMKKMQGELDELENSSSALTEKIELARSLPGEILKEAVIPVAGLTVEDGLPLVNGLPVSNLSEGEKFDLCINIALSRPNSLQLILLDGMEKFSLENRMKLYEKCKAKGLQFIATRTDNSNELEVTAL